MTLFEAYQEGLKLLKNPDQEEINLRIILCEINHINSMSEFYLKKSENIQDLQRFREVLQRFLSGEPLAYIFGKTSFYGDEFLVSKDVLIPRIETEEVVEFAINKINQKFGNKKIKIADVCSGSGCIGCELYKHANVEEVFFSDIDEKALEIAKKNGGKFGVKGTYQISDGLDYLKTPVQVVVSNPPYILKKEDVDESVLKHEPSLALFVDNELTIYKKIIEKSVLLNVPLIIFEIGYDLVEKLTKIIKEHAPMYEAEFKKDINGKFRICSLEKNE